MQTHYPFTLPRGLLLQEDTVFREGEMRLATAKDEIAVLGDTRVKSNRAFAVILLLSRVVTKLGDLEGDEITPDTIEQLFAADLAYLQGVYRELNE